jgi:hypothetical protein
MLDEKAFLSFFQPGKEPRDASLAYGSRAIFVFPLKPHDKPPVTKHGFKDATTKSEIIKQWWPVGSLNNIGIALQLSNIVVIDIDPRHGGVENFRALVDKHGSIPDTYTVRTGGGGWHYYYRVSSDFYEDASYPKKLADGVELLIKGYVVAPPSEVDGNPYVIEDGSPELEFSTLPFNWIDSVFADNRQSQYDSNWQPDSDSFIIPNTERNVSLTSLAGVLRNSSLNQKDLTDILHAVAHNHMSEHDYDDEVKAFIPEIARSICKYTPKGVPFYDRGVRFRKTVHKPVLNEVALDGPIGKWVTRTLPHSETSAAALLFQALTVFGNMIGATEHGGIAPGFTAEKSRHRTSMYVLLIGESAKAGKGDSWSQAYNFLSPLDLEWNHLTGVQTGEAIIKYMADDVETGEVAIINKEKVPHVKKGGTKDRRLCIHEPEFGRVMHVSKRPGANIKDVLKVYWDSGSTANITASEQRVSTEVTLSFVTHVTPHELHIDTLDGDFFNGYLNRFLFVHTERTQRLPDAQGLPEHKLDILRGPLLWALEFAREEAPETYEFSDDAWDRWVQLNKDMEKEDKEDVTDQIVSAMQSRKRPYVRRMAVIYAVSNMHDQIELSDLEAAIATYQYHVDTTKYHFGQYVSNPNANKLHKALLANPAGLLRSEITNEVFKRGKHASAQTEDAIRVLVEHGVAVSEKVHKEGSRKPSELIRLAQLPEQ